MCKNKCNESTLKEEVAVVNLEKCTVVDTDLKIEVKLVACKQCCSALDPKVTSPQSVELCNNECYQRFYRPIDSVENMGKGQGDEHYLSYFSDID